MFKTALSVLALSLVLGACAKKQSSLPKAPVIAPQQNEGESKPVAPTNNSATLLEGRWETACENFEDYNLQEPEVSAIGVVIVKGDALTYEEEMYEGYGCKNFTAVEYTVSYNIKIREISNSTMTHAVDVLKADKTVSRTWNFRLETNSFVADDGYRYSKVNN